MLSNKEIVCPNNLLLVAKKKKNVTAGIVNAGKPLPMHSAMEAVKENLITPIFIGNKNEIQKCAEQLKWDISKYEVIDEPVENNTAPIAAQLASKGKIKIIVKGHIHTDVLMKEILYPGQGMNSRYKRNLKKGIVIPKYILEDLKKLNAVK